MGLTDPIKRLETILEDIRRRLPEDVVWAVGEPALGKTDPARRIVMVPTTRTLEAPQGDIVEEESGKVHRVLLVRAENVVAHVYGRTLALVEELDELLANAIRASTMGPAVTPGPGDWMPDGPQMRGFVLRQTYVFHIPIVRRQTTARLTEFDPPTQVIETSV